MLCIRKIQVTDSPPGAAEDNLQCLVTILGICRHKVATKRLSAMMGWWGYCRWVADGWRRGDRGECLRAVTSRLSRRNRDSSRGGQRESEVLSGMWQKLGHTNQTQPSNKLRQSKVGSEEIRLNIHFLDSSKSNCCSWLYSINLSTIKRLIKRLQTWDRQRVQDSGMLL